MQYSSPDNFVLATGESYTVRQFAEFAFKVIDIDIKWEGTGIKEIGINAKTGEVMVKVKEDLFRLAEVDALIGDYTKARNTLGWSPTIKLEKICEIMVNSDLDKIGEKLKR